MPRSEVTLPDGSVVEFPEGMSDREIDDAIISMTTPQAAPAPPPPESFWKKGLRGLQATERAARMPIEWGMSKAWNVVTKPGEWLDEKTGASKRIGDFFVSDAAKTEKQLEALRKDPNVPPGTLPPPMDPEQARPYGEALGRTVADPWLLAGPAMKGAKGLKTLLSKPPVKAPIGALPPAPYEMPGYTRPPWVPEPKALPPVPTPRRQMLEGEEYLKTLRPVPTDPASRTKLREMYRTPIGAPAATEAMTREQLREQYKTPLAVALGTLLGGYGTSEAQEEPLGRPLGNGNGYNDPLRNPPFPQGYQQEPHRGPQATEVWHPMRKYPPKPVGPIEKAAREGVKTEALIAADLATAKVAEGIAGLPKIATMSPDAMAWSAKKATEIIKNNPEMAKEFALLKGEQLTDRLFGVVAAHADPAEIMAATGLVPQDLATAGRGTATVAGKILRSIQYFEVKFKQQVADEIGDLLAKRPRGADANASTFGMTWENLESLRRKLMVSNMMTAVRNLFTQGMGLGMHTVEGVISAHLAKAFGITPQYSPGIGFEIMLNMMRNKKTAAIVEDVLQHFPATEAQLFQFYEFPNATRTGVAGALQNTLAKAHRAADVLNTVNRFQEYMFRRATFAAYLDDMLKKSGSSLDEVVRTKDIEKINDGMLKEALSKSLELTWSQNPEYGTVGYHFIQLVNKTGATVLLPFPRFLVNSLQWVAEHSPLGAVALASKAEREAMKRGDFSRLSKVITGTGMLLTAYALREQFGEGMSWSQLKGPDGKVIDFEPFNPFTPYLWLANQAKKYREGRLHKIETADFLKAFGQNRGIGMEIFDAGIGQMLDIAQHEKRGPVAGAAAEQMAGEYVGSFLVPLAQLNDVVDQYKNWNGYPAREYMTRQSFVAPIVRNIPGLNEALLTPRGTVEYPYGAPKEMPLMRQLTGLTFQAAKSPIAVQMSKYKEEIERAFKPSGNPQYDAEFLKVAQAPFMLRMNKLVNSSDFLGGPEAQKSVLITKELQDVAEQAHDRMRRFQPQLAFQRQTLQMSNEEFAAIKARYGVVNPTTVRMYGEYLKRLRRDR